MRVDRASFECHWQPEDGWCDDVHLPSLYNRFVTFPFAGSAEHLWLEDTHVYDALAVIGWNDDPVVVRRGSAIFFHVAHPGYTGTAGCVTLALNDLLWVFARMDDETRMDISQQ